MRPALRNEPVPRAFKTDMNFVTRYRMFTVTIYHKGKAAKSTRKVFH